MERRKSKLAYAVILIPALLATSGLMTGCKNTEAKAEESAATVVPAATEVIAAQKGKLASNLDMPGELIAFQQVDIYAKENSFVKKLLVDVGSEVKEGDLLAVLEAPEINSQLAGAESRLSSQEASYIASRANYNRLFETSKTAGTVAPNDIDQALARKNSDSAQLSSAKAAFREIQELQNYLQIRAPFNGVITSRSINVGAYVGPSGKGSDLPMFTLQEQKKLRLVVAVPEAYAAYLNHKNEITFRVKAIPGKKFKATISRIAGALDTRLRSERIEMDVQNDNKELLPGMIADVNIDLPSQDSTFIVPKTTLVNSTEKMFVIRVTGDNKAEWVNVSKGREANDKVEIFGELKEGDRLIKKGSDEIHNGTSLQQVKQVSN